MTRNYARLQRRPFLTPIWLIVVGAVLVAGFLGIEVWLWTTADSTTVVVVRAAEPAESGADPALSAAGAARAAALAHLFGTGAAPGHIDAIYVTQTLQSRMTAAPLAARQGLTPAVEPADEPRRLARRVLRDHPGGRVLIVAPDGILTQLVAALANTQSVPALGDGEYGIVYVVTVPRIGRADFLRLDY